MATTTQIGQGKPKTDRFGLRPARKGIVRGRVRNVVRGAKLTEYGQFIQIDFELEVGGDAPPVPVHMEGTGLSGGFHEGSVLDVEDPDPSVRPIRAVRFRHPHHANAEGVMHHPERDKHPLAGGVSWGLLLVLGPPLALGLLIGLYYALAG